MAENKLTDKEIKKALECCTPENESCLNCPLIDVSVPECAGILYKATLDLINRQQAEIERLNNNISAMATTLSNSAKATRNEAIKEFAERLKEKLVEESYDDWQFFKVVGESEIDDLVKEMMGK